MFKGIDLVNVVCVHLVRGRGLTSVCATTDFFAYMSLEAGGDKTNPSNDRMIPLIGSDFSPVTLVLVMRVALHAQAG